MNPWGNPWQPGWYQQPYPNVYVPPAAAAPNYWGAEPAWNADAAYQHANRFTSRKYPQLNPILAADQTLLRYDVRVRPKDTIQASTYYPNAPVAALAKSGVKHLRLISRAFPWTIEVHPPMGGMITCETVWDAIYYALQEPLADSEWGVVVGGMGDKEKERREAIIKAAERREKKEAKDGGGRLKRIDWLGDVTLFKGLEKDEAFEKARLLPRMQSPGEYKGHTSCISEAEKYQKGLYKGPKTGQQGSAQISAAPPRNNYPPAPPAAPMPQGRGGWGRPQRVSVTGANDTPLGTPPPTPSTNGAPKVWGSANGNGNMNGQAETPVARTWGKKEEPVKVVQEVKEAQKINGNGAAAEANGKKRKAMDVSAENSSPGKKAKVALSEEIAEQHKEKKSKKEKKAAVEADPESTEKAEKKKKRKEAKESKKDKKAAVEVAEPTSEGESHKSKKRKRSDDMHDVEMAVPAEPVKEKKKKDKAAVKAADAMDVDAPPTPPTTEKKKSSKKDKGPAEVDLITQNEAKAKEARKREKREKKEKKRLAEAAAAGVAVLLLSIASALDAHQSKQQFFAVRDYLSPVLKESKFKEHGRITPEEFVAAGDFLAYKFPVWSWEKGDASKAREYLPADKQYLLTRGVPCLRRATSLAYTDADEDAERLLNFGDASGTGGEVDEWVETHAGRKATQDSALNAGDIDDIPDADGDGEAEGVTHAMGNLNIAHGGGGSAVGEIPDMDEIPDMEEDLEEGEDEAAAPAAPPKSAPAPAGGVIDATQVEVASGNLLQVRTYDVMITYDKYYQTPRIWLIGYDENRTPLTPAQIFQDISADHATKTVTIEAFPHSTSLQSASVHPCKHASVMKKVIERMNAGVVEEQLKQSKSAAAATGSKDSKKKWGFGKKTSGKEDKTLAAAAAQADEDNVDGMRVDFYLVVFLKFIASIVPTIEVDSTTAF
ncbi:hypothetical protein HWV62_8947 [Athelia sp. TMB]|nr:hypothetical protein HWV62_8947 [Athelia sp. TMB]